MPIVTSLSFMKSSYLTGIKLCVSPVQLKALTKYFISAGQVISVRKQRGLNSKMVYYPKSQTWDGRYGWLFKKNQILYYSVADPTITSKYTQFTFRLGRLSDNKSAVFELFEQFTMSVGNRLCYFSFFFFLLVDWFEYSPKSTYWT